MSPLENRERADGVTDAVARVEASHEEHVSPVAELRQRLGLGCEERHIDPVRDRDEPLTREEGAEGVDDGVGHRDAGIETKQNPTERPVGQAEQGIPGRNDAVQRPYRYPRPRTANRLEWKERPDRVMDVKHVETSPFE